MGELLGVDALGANVYAQNFDSNGNGSVGAGDAYNVGIGRRTIEVGPRITHNRTQAWHLVGGLKGDIPVLDGWSYDLSVQRGRTELSRVFENDLNGSRVQDILNGSSPTLNPNVVGLTAAQAGDGTRLCAPGTPSDCRVGSLFGDGSLNSAAASYIALSINEHVYTTQMGYQLKNR